MILVIGGAVNATRMMEDRISSPCQRGLYDQSALLSTDGWNLILSSLAKGTELPSAPPPLLLTFDWTTCLLLLTLRLLHEKLCLLWNLGMRQPS